MNETTLVGSGVLAGVRRNPGLDGFGLDIQFHRRWFRGGRCRSGFERGRRLMAGDFGEKRCILARDYRPITFPLHPVTRPLAHRSCQLRTRNQNIEVFEDRVLFMRAHGNLEADVVWKFSEGAYVGDDYGLAQTEGACKAAGGFAHRGIAQIEDDVACAHVFDEFLDGSKPDDANVFGETKGPDELRHRQLRMRFSNQNQANPGVKADKAAQSAQRLGNPFVGFEVPEGADERGGFIQAEFVAGRKPVGFRNPRTVRYGGDGAGKTLPAHLIGYEFAVHHEPPGSL